MKTHRILIILVCMAFMHTKTLAQNTRISNYNNIGWFDYFGTVKLNKKWSLHTEYQWRRNHLVTEWQQSLLRVGVNYQLIPKIQVRIGYAWAETFAYGNIPINGFGKDFTEHRTYIMATISDKAAKVDFAHRFMLEQRWVGRYSKANLDNEDQYLFLNRLRYMFRLQFPLKGSTIGNNTPYAAFYDEILIGFGKNVNENIFDQNRVGILLGYKFNDKIKIEAGYLNQTLQLGREVNTFNVFQYNNGIVLNTFINFDISKKENMKKNAIN